MYIQYNEPEQIIEKVFANLLKQLAQECGHLPVALVQLYERHRYRNTLPTLHEIVSTISSTLEEYKKVYCVVDAVDECSQEFQRILTKTLEHFQPKLRLLITSRSDLSIARLLSVFEHIEIKANRTDLELFIDHRIKRSKDLRRLAKENITLRNEVQTSIVGAAGDMYVYIIVNIVQCWLTNQTLDFCLLG